MAASSLDEFCTAWMDLIRSVNYFHHVRAQQIIPYTPEDDRTTASDIVADMQQIKKYANTVCDHAQALAVKE